MIDLVKRNCRDDGCCCVFDDDGETQLEWCKVHATMRDRIRELEAERDEAVTQMVEAKLANKGVADGTHVIVPVEPTEAMLEAGAELYVDGGRSDTFNDGANACAIYRAMIRAAQPYKLQQGE